MIELSFCTLPHSFRNLCVLFSAEQKVSVLLLLLYLATSQTTNRVSQCLYLGAHCSS
jgi:hypothetical protein